MHWPDPITSKCHELELNHPHLVLLDLPRAYLNKTRLTKNYQQNIDTWCYIQGKVLEVQFFRPRQAGSMIIELENFDRKLQLPLTCRLAFFRGQLWWRSKAQAGAWLRAYGQLKLVNNCWQMTHPLLDWLTDSSDPLPHFFHPCYRQLKASLQKPMRFLRKKILTQLSFLNQAIPSVPKDAPFFPAELDANLSLTTVIQQLHQPNKDLNFELLLQHNSSLHRRLAYEELTAYFLSKISNVHLSYQQVVKCTINHPLVNQFIAALPFQLTDGQQQILTTMNTWIQQKKLLCHLVQGDVGSGKTIIALILAVAAITQNGQVCFLAPTETLARQIFSKAQSYLKNFAISSHLLVGSLTPREKKKIQQQLFGGEIDLIIGTHALLQSDIRFKNLSLCIIDEQHRFGVRQRALLLQKGPTEAPPHLVMMSATPIPRSLAKAAYTELQLLELCDKPALRKTIETLIIAEHKREHLLERVQHWITSSAQQAFWVCPTIDPDNDEDIQSAKACYQNLTTLAPQLKIGLLHGQQHSRVQKKVMQDFCQQQLDILVATTIIEVGIDVPNANLMVIERAQQLGLSQLHQLRGRVGRGQQQGYCFLIAAASLTDMAKARLQIIRDSDDGFYLAEQDLKLRGPGEFLGTKQSGWPQLIVADWQLHQDFIVTAKKTATWLHQKHPELASAMVNWWQPNLEIVDEY